MITGNIRLVNEKTQLLIDPSTPEGKSSGLHGPSAVKCNNLVVVVQEDVQRVIGQVSPNQQAKADFCLKAVFDLA